MQYYCCYKFTNETLQPPPPKYQFDANRLVEYFYYNGLPPSKAHRCGYWDNVARYVHRLDSTEPVGKKKVETISPPEFSEGYRELSGGNREFFDGNQELSDDNHELSQSEGTVYHQH